MEQVQCCIAGGGPAGMMLGLLLARAGVKTLVLEKHADFLRDFRGDTLHPSTLQVMHELGLLEELLGLPHQRVSRFALQFGDKTIEIADLNRLDLPCKFVALMPQWDFLDLLARHARAYPNFELRMRAEVSDLIEDGGRVTGVRAMTTEGPLEVRSDLVVGADGRHSVVRDCAGLAVEELGVPLDVLWFGLARRDDDPENVMARVSSRRFCVMIDRGSYWQIAFLIPKGSIDTVHGRGLAAFRDDVRRAMPFLGERVEALATWDEIKLLTVRVDRLKRWHRPGLLCIGDAAHAMSPIAGVGINLAIQDAVAAANILAARLADGAVTEDDLARLQRRRAWPTRLTQRLQVFLQNRLIDPILSGARPPVPPPMFRLLLRLGLMRRIVGRMMGIGFRPEHVRSPKA